MTEKPRLCRTCEAPLRQSRAGRPPRYCSTGCRRFAERELRRLDRRIAVREGRWADLQRIHAWYEATGRAGRSLAAFTASEIATTEAAIGEATRQLRELLADS